MSSSSSSQQQRGGGRELQGPRPAPLRVHKDSHRVRKPPPQQRQPVIIYTVSPKVVHANPADFMSVVQRLTGASSSSSSLPTQLPPPPSSSSSLPFFPLLSSLSNSALPPAPQPQLPFPFQLQAAHDQLSPATRLAAFEQSRSGHPGGRLPGILSPMPGSLVPAVPPGFFSPPTGAGGINLLGELISPAFHGHTALPTGAGAAPHPTLHYLPAAAAAAPSPSPYYNWDLFNNHPDL